MNQVTTKEVWERPAIVRMDAADAKNGTKHHQDGTYYRRNHSILS